MKSEEILMLQALKLKKLNTRGYDGIDLVQHLVDQNEEAKTKLRNICAFISPELFEEINSLTNLLDLSKREFVEMALQDLVAKSHAVLEQTNAMEEH
jgi:hypothetical protein